MSFMDSFKIREKFLSFFKKNDHTIVPSSSLIPAQDPTLLFTNAGMNQFKDCFLGKEKRSYIRATSSQKCVRAGGKHNDLDQVGFTARHLTFFEMLGNFSFGDYFKKEAIEYAWEFLTKELNLDPEKLYPSVYKKDEDAYAIWRDDIKIPEKRITKLGEADNFWQMGDTGPCGPCSEIYFDRGQQYGCGSKECAPGCECDRFVEIWNLVFMQYDRQLDGELKPLEQTGVDTGLGLERLCMIMQNKENVFNIDQLQFLIDEAQKFSGKNYAKSSEKLQASFHVLADHVRASSLLIADGCSPSNDGRGYVLRKIIRRAALFAQKLSDDNKLLVNLAYSFIKHMGAVYPELEKSKTLIISVLESEIQKFAINLVNGQNILEKYIAQAKKESSGEKKNILSGEHVFKLYDTYGFPPELTGLLCQEQGLEIDTSGFEQEMAKQKKLSGKKMKETQAEEIIVKDLSTEFIGYDTLENESSVQFVTNLNDHIWLSTQESPFYVESGGQVGDTGYIIVNDQKFSVLELKKAGDTFAPAILVKIANKTVDNQDAKAIKLGDSVKSIVDKDKRLSTVKNHTATHMLQAALTKILGPQVKQAGSLVNDHYFRFDFTHHKALTQKEIEQVETLVNQKIQENIELKIDNKTLDEAQKEGVLAFFGEKYNPEQVRIVRIPGFSKELCGGTHATSTGTIGCFKIISETALATGTRRVTGVSGLQAIKLFQNSFSMIKCLCEQFKAKPEKVFDAVCKQQESYQEALSAVKRLKRQLTHARIGQWAEQITPINLSEEACKIAGESVSSIPFLYLVLEDSSSDDMRSICQELERVKPGFYVLINKSQDKANKRFAFMGYVSKQYANILNLKEFSLFLKENFGIKGGGSPLFIQGGGTELCPKLNEEIVRWVSKNA